MKRKLIERMPAKVGAFVLLMILSLTLIASAVGALAMLDNQYYTKREQDVVYQVLFSKAYQTAEMICMDYYFDNGDSVQLDISPNVTYSVANVGEEPFFSNIAQGSYGNDRYFFYSDELICDYDMDSRCFSVTVCVDTAFPVQDAFSLAAKLVHVMYRCRYIVYGVIGVALLGAISCFSFLICAVGHREGRLYGGAAEKLPFDVATVLMICSGLLWTEVMIEDSVAALAGAFLLIGAAILYCMLFALQIKTKSFAKALLLTKLLKLLKKGFSALLYLIMALPQTVLGVLVFLAVDAVCLAMISFSGGADRFALWILFSMAGLVITLYVSLMVRRLYDATDAIAGGNMDYHVDTGRMRFHFLKAGNNLNSIAAGLQKAVEKGVKSERLKTELITNVSHDIKTPLTSIINYTDLICKEETDNERIKSYSGELLNQSQRLKKLIEDLIEASKASTGNIEVKPEPCQVNVMLEQVAGEYLQKLAENDLTLVTRWPETPVFILADGRRLWRVFDNLLNNAAKYSQRGTRVYLTLAQQDREAVITLKNVSNYELNVSAEELMERFVRGDRSRSTEGNGLGLSIARSLTELQGGKLALSVDADLFTAELRFSVLEA